jgi:hypothetical protein
MPAASGSTTSSALSGDALRADPDDPVGAALGSTTGSSSIGLLAGVTGKEDRETGQSGGS